MRLRALEEAPFAFGSKLADWQGDGDTEERWRSRLIAVPFNVIASLDGAPVGQVSSTELDAKRDAELLSMWVVPEARGEGVGHALIDGVADWARGEGATGLVLWVNETNADAIALYERHSFQSTGSIRDGEQRMQMSLTSGDDLKTA